jgi:signal transduction histidine kinase
MLAGERVESPRDRAMLESFDVEVQQTLEDLRNVADHGAPRRLSEDGPALALKVAAAHSGMPVTVKVDGLTRQPAIVESTIYFCCLECLQNAAKHAGPQASVAIELVQQDGHVTFTVEDDGNGFDPHTSERGAGLSNLAHRVSAIGGTLEIEAVPGRGARITGRLPSGTAPD